MLAGVEDDTAEVVIVKDAVAPPAGTVTKAGVTAAEELLLSVITAPPAGADSVKVKVP
jgi:hypothetical protein